MFWEGEKREFGHREKRKEKGRYPCVDSLLPLWPRPYLSPAHRLWAQASARPQLSHPVLFAVRPTV